MFLCHWNYMWMHSLELHVCNAMPIHVCKFDIVCASVIQSQGLVFMSLKGTSLKHSFIVLSVHIMYNQVNFFFTFLLQVFYVCSYQQRRFYFIVLSMYYVFIFCSFLPEWFDIFVAPFVYVYMLDVVFIHVHVDT